MTSHDVDILWTSDGQFATGRYSRAHELRFDGGQVVRGSSSPSVVPVPRSDPFGVDPEEALVASAAACHMLWFLDLARRDGFDIASYRDGASGEMGAMDDGRTGITRIVLRPAIAFAGRQPTEAELADLHDRAHHHCFIAASLKSEVVVESGAFVESDPAAAAPAG